MNIKVKTIKSTDAAVWDAYVHAHPRAILYHLAGWQNVITKTYGHKPYYLMAMKSNKSSNSPVKPFPEFNDRTNTTIPVVGILPLIHLKHILFGNSLISIPFFDIGGLLASDEEAEKALLFKAINLAKNLKARNIELRHIEPLSPLNKGSKCLAMNYELSAISCFTRSHKVRMLLDLPESSEILMKSFKSKLRSQIKKPLKEGLNSKVGGIELLNDFYEVFSANMRDLGSPVHSKRLMLNILDIFPDKARIVMVYKDDQPLACGLVIGFKDILENPWASALRKYSRLSPNMLLYWTMLEYACNHGYRKFDFGRSSPDEGTYKFKEQWGARPSTLHWHYISLKSQAITKDTSEKAKFERAIHYWRKMPVSITKIIGPIIRKNIGL